MSRRTTEECRCGAHPESVRRNSPMLLASLGWAKSRALQFVRQHNSVRQAVGSVEKMFGDAQLRDRAI